MEFKNLTFEIGWYIFKYYVFRFFEKSQKNKKSQIVFCFRISLYTFATENWEEKFELIATSLKNAKAETLL